MEHNSSSQHHLGVNKLGKIIRKSHLQQTSFQKLTQAGLNQQQPAPPPQPQVYNISKSDFRSVVQQLTGSPARDPTAGGYPPLPARPPQPKHPSSRLIKIRPPPLTPISRLPQPPLFQNQLPISGHPRAAPSPTAGNLAWSDSPVSAYMRYLESSLLTSDGSGKPSPLENPHPSSFAQAQLALLPSPAAPFPLLSPNSQFLLPSPSSFLNLISPKSPYPLLSPRFQYPIPPTPNFSFSPFPQSGVMGPGPGSQPPPSPSLLFPQSPSGFLPLLSPRWRDM